MTNEENMIAGLLREREGYVQRGLTDRVAEVDEQLAKYGHEPASEPRAAQPKARRAPRRETA